MTLKELEAIAFTARIGLTEEEKEVFPEQISQILSLIRVLDGVDTHAAAPTHYPIRQESFLREDAVEPSLPLEQVFANGPDVVDGYFRVPRIIEEE
ncbi:MAG TPA: Asp-tRNA(Asn)/Glu-tRNA(Gln) amidotransferase subunit GatC [Firmicutes bacterium]|nr:Asp-tRNA(Asn)/Glu-tRNA(Gln) amidotransferase subunit GatC [Bacillota bacterium]